MNRILRAVKGDLILYNTMSFKTFTEFLEWRGQRGEQETGKDIRKTGGRPKGTWVPGNMRYGHHGGEGSMKPHVNREFDKRQTRKDVEQGLSDRD